MGRAQVAREQLRASTAEGHLQGLQAQVEPHFLGNPLANVKWLYRRDPESGRRMLDRLVDYLHAALPQVRQATTTLEQELRLAQAYLDIQQLRIGGRLAFSIDVPDEIARLNFPPLLLQPLVENSIKHGIAPQTDGGVIDPRRADERTLRIEVRDTGRGLRSEGHQAQARQRARALRRSSAPARASSSSRTCRTAWSRRSRSRDEPPPALVQLEGRAVFMGFCAALRCGRGAA